MRCISRRTTRYAVWKHLSETHVFFYQTSHTTLFFMFVLTTERKQVVVDKCPKINRVCICSYQLVYSQTYLLFSIHHTPDASDLRTLNVHNFANQLLLSELLRNISIPSITPHLSSHLFSLATLTLHTYYQTFHFHEKKLAVIMLFPAIIFRRKYYSCYHYSF